MSPSDMPDFDNMSPEEITAWMESLAKRQGASEGFTTAADVDIPEIDPDTVVIDEPGYVPYGEESSSKKTAPEPAKVQPAAVAKPAEPPPPAPAPTPVRETPPEPTRQPERRPVSSPTTPPWDVERPAAAKPVEPPARQAPASAPSNPAIRSIPTPPAPARQPDPAPVRAAPPAASIPETRPVQPPLPPTPAPVAAESVDAGALAWLESLAADQGDDLFNLDLSGVSISDEPETPRGLDNPMTWLEDLARSQGGGGQEMPALGLDRFEDDIDEGSEKIDPFASGANPVEWLETLARREGVDSSELTTDARLNIPAPDAEAVEPAAYTPFSFDSPLTRPRLVDEDKTPVNPADFLNSLADDEGYSESGVRATVPTPVNEAEEFDDSLSPDSILSAISSGTVTSDQMQSFLDQKAEELASNPDMLIFGDEEEEDAPLVAEIPDWLHDMRPSEDEIIAPPTKSLETLFEAEAESLEIPDWLREADEDSDSEEIASIFADSSDDLPETIVSGVRGVTDYAIEVDPNDPWVEAFDLEHELGAQDIGVVPDWYDQNINDADRIAAVDRQFPGQSSETVGGEPLVNVPLPVESTLPLGQPQLVPAWLTGFEQVVVAPPTPAPVLETPFISDMPDWLKEIEVPDDVPDWLVETFSEVSPVEDEPEVFQPEPEPAPVAAAPVAPPPRPVAPRPAAPPPQPAQPRVVVSDEEAMTKLQSARDLEQAGDLETSLTEYEGLIRSNRALDVVVEDLTQLLRSYRTVPAVYRVLGDGLMRQGKLQAALNTYREALNQL